jgi:hypothetical protein
MGLSEREQKLLEEMERNLMAQDAEFAKTISSTTSANQSAGKLVLGVLILLSGLGLLPAQTLDFRNFQPREKNRRQPSLRIVGINASATNSKNLI